MPIVKKLSTILCFFCVFCISCAKNEADATLLPDSYTVFTAIPIWYVVTESGLTHTPTPISGNPVPLKPWTEAKCITDTGISGLSTFFLINKVGIADFKKERHDGTATLYIHQWDQRFNDATAISIDMFNGTPVIRLYQNTFFNTGNNGTKTLPTFLQWDRTTNLIAPFTSILHNLIPDGYNMSALEKTADGYVALFKQADDTRISFIYRAILPNADESADGYIRGYDITDISADEYKKRITPRDFATAPESLQLLLKYLQNVPFKLTVVTVKNKAVGPESDRNGTYINGAITADADNTPEGFAIASDTYNAALFSDGTFYYAYGNTSPIAAKLPLPIKNMVYRKFSISGTTLLAAWEESVFYETGKAGLLQLDLQK